MEIDADIGFLTEILLLSARLGAVLLFTPLFSVASVPANIRVAFIVSLAFVLLSGLGQSGSPAIATMSGLMLALVNEVALGALLGFGVQVAFGAFVFAGKMLDLQMGFGVAELINPGTNSHEPLLGTVLNLMAVITFFLVDGHHLLLRGISYSLQRVPLGSGLYSFDITLVVAMFGQMFIYGLMVAAPVLFVLLLVDVGMAIASRSMPQLNIFIVSLPLKIFVGLMVLALSLSHLKALINIIFVAPFRYWERVING